MQAEAFIPRLRVCAVLLFSLKRILVIKLSDIGDVLTATPALRALRETYRAARIDVLVPPRSAAVLQGSALLDELIAFDKFAYDRVRGALALGALQQALGFFLRLRARRYDTLILLHHLSTRWGALKWAALSFAVGAKVRAGLDNGRGWFLTHRVRDNGFGARHEVEYCAEVVRALGAEIRDWRLAIGIAESDRVAATQQLESKIKNQKSKIALHPGSGGHSLARRWPLERWAQLGCMLIETYHAQIVIVGTASDGGHALAAQLPSALNLTDQTTLPQLAAILQRCDLFVGADSGVMHVATAAGVPVVALFGTTNPKAWGPWCPDGRCAVVQSDTPGCPCSYVGFQIRSTECEARACMEGIAVEKVVEAVAEIMQYTGTQVHR